MNILRQDLGHDCSCTVKKKGLMVLTCEEERYFKEKHTRSFPINAINDCLKIGRTKVKDKDIMSVGLPQNILENFILIKFYRIKK